MYHATLWSSSPSTNENRYRTTHHKRTKQRGRDSWTGEQRYLEYETTWEEIEVVGRPR